MSRHKEPRFFALKGQTLAFNGPGDMSRFHFVTELEQYEALFDGVRTEKAVGEASPWYLYVPQSAERIKHHLPNAKLIAILRDPVDRAYSNFLHAQREELEPLADFTAAMDAEADRIAQNWSYRWHYKQKGFYFNQVKRYFDIFGQDRVKVYLYDDLKADPRQLLQNICGFLGVDETFEWDTSQRFNVAGTPRNRAVAGALERSRRLAPLVRRSEGLRRLARSMKDTFAAANTAPAPKLSPVVRARFIAEYHDDVLQLQDLLDRDLSTWLET